MAELLLESLQAVGIAAAADGGDGGGDGGGVVAVVGPEQVLIEIGQIRGGDGRRVGLGKIACIEPEIRRQDGLSQSLRLGVVGSGGLAEGAAPDWRCHAGPEARRLPADPKGFHGA